MVTLSKNTSVLPMTLKSEERLAGQSSHCHISLTVRLEHVFVVKHVMSMLFLPGQKVRTLLTLHGVYTVVGHLGVLTDIGQLGHSIKVVGVEAPLCM